MRLLIQREELDAILLAGTDFSFVFNPENTDFPNLDRSRTHMESKLNRLTSLVPGGGLEVCRGLDGT